MPPERREGLVSGEVRGTAVGACDNYERKGEK